MSSILRGVVVGRETRALARPVSPAASVPVNTAPVQARAGSVQTPAADAAQQRSAGFDAGFKDGQEQGRKQGFAEGFQQAQARGQEEGFQAGQEQGLRGAQQELDRLHAHAEQAAREHGQRVDKLLVVMDTALQERLAAGEEEMLALCFEAVAAVFGELAARSEGVRALVQQVLAQSRQLGPAVVHLHPKDLALIADDLQALGAGQPARKLQFVADEGVEFGGCVLATPQGGLDARIETQLARLAQVFRRTRDDEKAA